MSRETRASGIGVERLRDIEEQERQCIKEFCDDVFILLLVGNDLFDFVSHEKNFERLSYLRTLYDKLSEIAETFGHQYACLEGRHAIATLNGGATFSIGKVVWRDQEATEEEGERLPQS